MSGDLYNIDFTGKIVLVIWLEAREKLEKAIRLLKKKNYTVGNLKLENVGQLKLANYGASTFDIVLSNLHTPYTYEHSTDILGELHRILKPSGKFIFRAAVETEQGIELKTEAEILSSLKLSGWVTTQVLPVYLSDAEKYKISSVMKISTPFKVIEVVNQKSNYEGESLNELFKKVVSTSVSSEWKFEEVEDFDIDNNQLLDEKDLKKPHPATLRACETKWWKKTYKNNSCGLAEDLGAVSAEDMSTEPQTSSCGDAQCSLGDAYRCSTCPYLGMPAFKPGEKSPTLR